MINESKSSTKNSSTESPENKIGDIVHDNLLKILKAELDHMYEKVIDTQITVYEMDIKIDLILKHLKIENPMVTRTKPYLLEIIELIKEKMQARPALSKDQIINYITGKFNQINKEHAAMLYEIAEKEMR